MGVALAAAMLLPGCVVRTAVDVAKMPVQAGSKAVDWSTTSKSEAERNRGRKLAKQCKKNYDPQYCGDRH